MSAKAYGKRTFHVPFDLDGEELLDRGAPLAQHFRALRLGESDEVVLVGPSERPVRAKVIWEARGALRLMKVSDERTQQTAPDLALAMAWPRPQTLSDILPLLGNLGLREVSLLPSERAQGQWSVPSADRVSRARRLLQSGAEVAGHLTQPELLTPNHMGEWHMSSHRQWFLLDADGPKLEPVEGPVGVIVGPEGGWSDVEKNRFIEQGATPVSLGPFNLLVEAAVFCALGVFFVHNAEVPSRS